MSNSSWVTHHEFTRTKQVLSGDHESYSNSRRVCSIFYLFSCFEGWHSLAMWKKNFLKLEFLGLWFKKNQRTNEFEFELLKILQFWIFNKSHMPFQVWESVVVSVRFFFPLLSVFLRSVHLFYFPANVSRVRSCM